MIAIVYIDGRKVGEFEYQHPKDSRGNVVALPQNGDASEVAVVMIGPLDNDHRPIWSGKTKLGRCQ